MVNESLSYLRSHKLAFVYEINENDFREDAIADINLDVEHWQKLIDELPNGCKTVFNLHIFEGFKHQEIADKLSISVSTSKTQFAHAKKILQHKIIQHNSSGHEQSKQ